MGAVPKNKITSVERGKRRRGNTPKLVRQTKHHKVPLGKRGLVAQIFKAFNLKAETQPEAKAKESKKPTTTNTKKTAKKKTPKTNTSSNQPKLATKKTQKPASQAVGPARKTQHKG